MAETHLLNIGDVHFEIIDVDGQIRDVASELAARRGQTSFAEYLLPQQRLSSLSPDGFIFINNSSTASMPPSWQPKNTVPSRKPVEFLGRCTQRSDLARALHESVWNGAEDIHAEGL